MGEELRQLLIIKKKWRGKCLLLDSVSDIIQIKEYRKGREPFILLLGSYGRCFYNDVLGGMLNDDEIVGHVIDSLYKGKAPEYEKEILQIYKLKKGWIKRMAKKYLENRMKW